jgi:Kef-type K+ transport system membrane component KefB
MLLALLTHDPLAGTLMLLALLWLSAKVGGELAVRLKLPAVTGELAVGLGLTALHRLWPWFPEVGASQGTELLGGLGVVVLMFAVGLESTVAQMLKVGWASLRVAVLGVAAPMAAGLAGAWLLLPRPASLVLDLFIGACLCATSVGISAQVLRETGASDSLEGRIIVGAAVVDDVLGLLVLVAVSGMVGAASGGGALGPQLLRTLGLALGFLALALTLGRLATPHLFQLASRFRGEQVLLPLGLGFAFLLAWLGSLAGLASIVGAYAAGLILEPAHIVDLERRERHTLEELIHPLVTVLSPLFFVLMGAKVDPSVLLRPRTLLFATVLALLGVAGKFVAGFGAGRGLRASVVGWGMVPRGEVGLIFVATGAQLRLNGVPLLSPELQAGIIGALLLTTVAGPVGLGRVLRSGQ